MSLGWESANHITGFLISNIMDYFEFLHIEIHPVKEITREYIQEKKNTITLLYYGRHELDSRLFL